MKRVWTALSASIATIAMTGAVSAHSSLVPHSHPHAVSALPSVSTVITTIALAGIATALVIAVAMRNADKPAARKIRRKP